MRLRSRARRARVLPDHRKVGGEPEDLLPIDLVQGHAIGARVGGRWSWASARARSLWFQSASRVSATSRLAGSTSRYRWRAQLGFVLGALDLEAAQPIRLLELRLDLLLYGQGHLDRQRRHGRDQQRADGGIDGGPVDTLAGRLGEPLAKAMTVT